jgi:hypothetical protein
VACQLSARDPERADPGRVNPLGVSWRPTLVSDLGPCDLAGRATAGRRQGERALRAGGAGQRRHGWRGFQPRWDEIAALQPRVLE